jgi:pseudaminic acid synthase
MTLLDKIYNKDVYIIAEMSANHAGKLENALKIVHAAKNAGADCIKIQTYTADTMTIPYDNEHFRTKGGMWDGITLYELYNQAYTPWEWHRAIKNECEKVGLDFLSTPFDKSAVDFLEEIGVEFYKIASFEIVDIPLIEYVASKGKPVIMSCGMASPEEISEALEAAYSQGNRDVILLKCCSEYPANYNDMNLATITDMKEHYSVPVGLSDHSMGSMAAVAAVCLGACVIEKHFCISRKIKNPDCEFSMEPHEFEHMVKEIHLAKSIVGRCSYELSENEKTSVVFRRSIFAIKDIKKGEQFTENNIRIIRPGYGLKPKHWKYVIGKRACCDIKKGTPISDEHIISLKQASFESKRLIFRGILREDAKNIVQWRSDEQNYHYFFNPVPVQMDTHLLWFEKYLNDDTRFDFIIIEKETNREIGTVGLQNITDKSADISYMIGEIDAQKKGYGSEAIRALSSFSFNNLNLESINAVVHIKNIASQKAAQKAAYTPSYITYTLRREKE